MSKATVALAMIVSAGTDKETTNLANCLGSINGYVDAIYIQLNAPEGVKINQKMRQVAEQFTKNIYTYTWTSNFAAARNDIFAKVSKKYDWVMWLDADDKVDNPENIIPSLTVMPADVRGVYALYDYQTDEYGNVIISHWNTRVVRNDGSFAWRSSFDDAEVSVHETLIATRNVRSAANDEWKVIHQADQDHHRESLIRNIELLEGMYERQSESDEGIDPRVMYYLATHYYDAYNFREAKQLFYEYLKASGWAEERSEAHVYMGKLLKMENNLSGARTAFLMAMGEYPENQGAYLELAILEAKSKRWEQSANWAKRGLDIKSKITAMVRYNRDYDLLTYKAQALSNLGGKHLPEALKMAEKALKLRPFSDEAKENRDNISKLVDYRSNLRGVARLLRVLKAAKEDDKIVPFLDALPSELTDSPLVIEARQQNTLPATWPKNTIAIYVGQGALGTWSPKNLNNGGLGGSEEAVIRLTQELARLNWAVTVFGTPSKDAGWYRANDNERIDMVASFGKYTEDLKTGQNHVAREEDRYVEWKHYWEFNPLDKFDVLVSWRQPAMFDLPIKARKKYLWLHDVVPAEELTPERIKNVTKVIYVSKYHSERPENQHIGARSKLASGNGITPSDFIKYDGQFRRDNHRCIYMSANERGLRILLDIWPQVKKAVPDATLDAYYGWHSFDAINRDNPERMAWKATMVARMKELDGVTERGRIGQDDLNKEIFKSGVFAYPSFFPEVNCITAQKAQAGGAWPVTSNFAALNDVILYGDKLDMGKFEADDIERYKLALIDRLKNPPSEKARQTMMREARQKYAWKQTAEQWNSEFNS